jgi:hypothetical protein
MKKTYQGDQSYINFLPGKIAKNGFFGKDARQIYNIISDDQKVLSGLKVTKEQIADRMQFFIDKGNEAIESKIDLEDFQVRVMWSKGKIPCPFAEPGLFHKTVAVVSNKKLHKQITYSQLNVHLIREHGFFEGKGSSFRLEPEALIEILNFAT